MSEPRYILGLDLGEAQDFTAIAILEQGRPLGARHAHYKVRHLERPPLGTSYPAIAYRVAV